jgi:cytochrome c biogenesis protein CcdA
MMVESRAPPAWCESLHDRSPTMRPLILFLTITLPIAWLASEFQDRRWVRIAAGIAALSMSFLVATGVGSLERLNANAWSEAVRVAHRVTQGDGVQAEHGAAGTRVT